MNHVLPTTIPTWLMTAKLDGVDNSILFSPLTTFLIIILNQFIIFFHLILFKILFISLFFIYETIQALIKKECMKLE